MRTAIDYFPKVPIGEVVEGHIWTGVSWEREPTFQFPSAKSALIFTAIVLAATGAAAFLVNTLNQPTYSAAPQTSTSAGAAPPPDYRSDESLAETEKSVEREEESISSGAQYGVYPDDERKFVTVVLEYREELSTTHDAQKEAIMIRKRDKELTEILGDGLRVKHWVGTVVDKGVTAEGRGYVMVEIAQDLRLVTWSTAFSDLTSATLLLPGSAIYDEFEKASIGQQVAITGHLLPGEDTALDQGNWTEKNYGVKPEFLFHFEHIHPQAPPRRTPKLPD